MIYNAIKIIFAILLLVALFQFSQAIWSLWPAALIAISYALLMLLLSTNIRFNFFKEAYHSNPDFPDNAVALSFDDGPVEITLEILDILDQFDVKAAFFCIGERIAENPKIFQEIIRRGHIVGNHTYSHTRKIGFLKADKIIAEIEQCDRIAFEVGAVKLNLFRPPFGILNPKTARALEKTGHAVIGWNKRPYDAITSSPDLILKRITKNLKKGDLILLHDNMPKTPAILEQLLVILEQRNLKTVRPDILFKIDAYN